MKEWDARNNGKPKKLYYFNINANFENFLLMPSFKRF